MAPPVAVSFALLPGECFRFSVASDKLETVVTLEGASSKDQWECRVGDAELKRAGPEGVEIPRTVVTALLVETLDKLKQRQEDKARGSRAASGDDESSSGHSVEVRREASSSSLFLDLTLDFGAGWRPTYTLELKQLDVKTEDKLRAQIVDLQNELAEVRLEMEALVKGRADAKALKDLRQEIEELREQLKQQANKCASKYRHGVVGAQYD